MSLAQPTTTTATFNILAGSRTATRVPCHIFVDLRSVTLQMLVSIAQLISSFLHAHQTLAAKQSIFFRRLQPLRSRLRLNPHSPAALPSYHTPPRFRALALFSCRPQECVESSVITGGRKPAHNRP
jgi:hypothetical protein